MQKILRTVPDFIANSNLFIAICSYFFTLFCCETMKIFSRRRIEFALLVGCSVFFIYGLQRLYFVKFKPVITSREKWYRQHFTFMTFLVSLSAAAIVFFIFRFPSELIFYFSAPALLSLLYYLGPVPLRKIFAVKGFVIGFVWALTSVVIPFLIFYPDMYAGKMILIGAYVFFFLAAICGPFDIRDVHEDADRNIRSIPVVYGIRFSVIVGITLSLLFILFFLVPQFSSETVIAMILTGIITGLTIAFSNPGRNRLYFSLLVDGMLLLPFFLLRLIQLL